MSNHCQRTISLTLLDYLCLTDQSLLLMSDRSSSTSFYLIDSCLSLSLILCLAILLFLLLTSNLSEISILASTILNLHFIDFLPAVSKQRFLFFLLPLFSQSDFLNFSFFHSFFWTTQRTLLSQPHPIQPNLITTSNLKITSESQSA